MPDLSHAPHEVRELAHALLNGAPAPEHTHLDARARVDLTAIERAGHDAARILGAVLRTHFPAASLHSLAGLAHRTDLKAIFDAQVDDLALLAGSSPWAVELAEAHLADVFTTDEPRALARLAMRFSDPVRAGETANVGARTIGEWRALIQARAALYDLRDEGDAWAALDAHSAPADAACVLALAQAWRETRAAHGIAATGDGIPCAFAVLGMGKLGGRELNASSDIDLIYLYESDDAVAEDGRSVAEWYVELARRLTDLLGGGGAGLRVDMRLRPGQSAGALACSLAAAESHYESFGQAWERQMLIRARAVAGSARLGRRFVETVRPFVYRRRMDPRALAEIRRVKRRLDAEVAVAAGGDDNVKLARGGIRELEYVVQTYQLLYGGREIALQTPSLRSALDVIEQLDLLPSPDVGALRVAYIFLRRLENRIQMYDGRQNHRLPPDGPVREGLARSMGCATVAEMMLLYEGHRRRVLGIFEDLFAVTDEGGTPEKPDTEDGTLLVATVRHASVAQLAATGIEDPNAAFDIFRRIGALPLVRSSKNASLVVERMAYGLCRIAAEMPDPTGALERLERWLNQQNAMATQLSMLADDEQMARVLLGLLGRGSYLADLLIDHPEGFVPMFVAQDVSGGPEQVERALIEASERDDPREALAELRRTKTTLELQIALEELYRPQEPEGAWALGRGLATGALKAVASICARAMGIEADDLGILMLGSVGNGEPVMNSDLDLVFVHDDMERASPATRLAQRVLKELDVKSPQGFLFRTDLRLRPFGTQGVLVSSVVAARKFYCDAAPVTTRFALLRLRAVCGTPATTFMNAWAETVYERGWTTEDQAELAGVRARIHAQVPSGRRDVKNEPGTLSDIEFFVAREQLRRGGDERVRIVNTRAALAALHDAGAISSDDYRALGEALRWYKRLSSHLRIIFPRPVSEWPEKPAELRVLARMMGMKTAQDLATAYEDTRRAVLAVVDSTLGNAAT
ncbi:MAG: hypothetical protein IT350_11870 [Deltaproteobacteria bacterium]|nr:hypothetical protein [Deltaproteobacteria bacterium]